jgi:hypothetical protein
MKPSLLNAALLALCLLSLAACGGDKPLTEQVRETLTPTPLPDPKPAEENEAVILSGRAECRPYLFQLGQLKRHILEEGCAGDSVMQTLALDPPADCDAAVQARCEKSANKPACLDILRRTYLDSCREDSCRVSAAKLVCPGAQPPPKLPGKQPAKPKSKPAPAS